jgi:uncharacterized damage-inducible protein DinB
MTQRGSSAVKPPGAAQPEPWLRGTLTDVSAVPRAVLHALELASEDLLKWCGSLTDEELNARPAELPPVAFHLRHITQSLDRLLTYAEGRALTREQLGALKDEMETGATRDALFADLNSALIRSSDRVRVLALADLDEPRTVGKKALPTTLGGLLVHIADHTQRHVGQAVTTARVILAQRA